MPLKISLGQHSERGRKEVNQDFHGAWIPEEPLLGAKGIAIALADGISSSAVSQEASEAAVRGFLESYYDTSQALSVKKSAQQVLQSVNTWLHSQTRRGPLRYEEKDRGYVCTLSALVLKSTTAHVFHVGDTRVYRLRGGALEQLTQDHRLVISPDKSYLSRAMGVESRLDLEYQAHHVDPGDVFVLATDGVYEHASARFIANAVADHAADLDAAARAIVAEAFERGSDDNLTVQIVRVDELPRGEAREARQLVAELPFPPPLAPRSEIDGYVILRQLHVSARSQLFLVRDATGDESSVPVVLKVLSTELRDDPAQVDRFLMEDWIAQRIDSAHVVRRRDSGRRKTCLYNVTEYIEGRTLAQWMIDNPRPDLESVRAIAEQIARGLTAFHRQEMLHQDLRPANVMIDRAGTVKIIDLGSTRVAGVAESRGEDEQLLGTVQYTAPEYFLGEYGTPRSDLFSLGVIVYQMLSGRLPYGADVSRARTRAAQRRLVYRSVLHDERDIPRWIDEVLRKATHVDPVRRYAEPAEFAHGLRHPDPAWLERRRQPLLERNPVRFWQMVAAILFVSLLVAISRLS
ncbi:MAG TPA: bifunctional protein-serine/threonine kinase/phosphatase [Steroidobacteraceae bacterium]|nr:bifunctional protein-serine/threonine kinase/phosphatase [Steroidobacteraceae bacterium]